MSEGKLQRYVRIANAPFLSRRCRFLITRIISGSRECQSSPSASCAEMADAEAHGKMVNIPMAISCIETRQGVIGVYSTEPSTIDGLIHFLCQRLDHRIDWLTSAQK
jgi:hypothetical protein